jgi:hypothetical protein
MISQLFEHHLLPQEAKAKHKATLCVTLLKVIISCYSSSTNHIFKWLQKHTIDVLLFKRQDFTINWEKVCRELDKLLKTTTKLKGQLKCGEIFP